MMRLITGAWGDKYPPEYGEKLRRGIARHTDRQFTLEVIDCELLGHPSWWSKMTLFTDPEPKMWLDVDTVVVGDIAPIWDVYSHVSTGTIAAPANWAQSGHGGIQSSMLIFGDCRQVWGHYMQGPEYYQSKLHGDQEFLTYMRDQGQLAHIETAPELLRSYKYHSRGGPPEGCALVTFHGNPKPHEAGGWVKDAWL